MSYLVPDYSQMNEKEKKEYEASIKFFYTAMMIAVFVYYVIPYILKYAMGGTFGNELAGLALFSLYPMYVFIASMLYSKRYGFQIVIPLSLSVFFIPASIVMYKNLMVSVFAFMYFVMGLCGGFTGYLFVRRSKMKKQPVGLNTLEKIATKERKAGKSNQNVNNKSKNKKSKGRK